jgi:chorismate lyase / 3-hydroxybenzoate synthase
MMLTESHAILQPSAPPTHPVALAVDYVCADYVRADAPQSLLTDDTLAIFGFGDDAPHWDDPRYLRVPLQPYGDAVFERWRSAGPVRWGRDSDADATVRWSSDGRLTFGVIEIDERPGGDPGATAHNHSDICEAAERAYRALVRFLDGSATPHLLRVWNYLDAITLGDGDAERYRQFCIGRAHGLGRFDPQGLPAATAIGRCDGRRTLQVYWLCADRRGTPVENPRQVSAYRYPREYGPQPPSFARAMLPPPGSHMPLLLSGTASVVGHASQHVGELLAQIGETFANFDALLVEARKLEPELPAAFGNGTRLKVYVRDAGDLPLVARALDQRFGDRVPHLILHAAICRRELAVEIDGVHG